ncbi:MAG: NADH-quinone oxidoreductase subunit N [Saprospiraceae bacterium]|nr:NADH-quinone oxidoreductase subunit N [Saprospiraceae bacterium]
MVTVEALGYIMPEIVLAIGAVVVMLMIAVKRNAILTNVATILTFIIALFFLINQPQQDVNVTNLFFVDSIGRFLTGLILCSAIVITIYSLPYFKNQKELKEEYYILLILATLGSVCMGISNHFVSFVISLELLSVSLFALIGYLRHESTSIEAALKYLIMAAVATSFILFGFALIYTVTGKMDLQGLTSFSSGSNMNFIMLAGFAMTIVGFGFKMALTPFHLWTPDIYSAAPAPVAAFIATISKGAAFVFLLRLFYNLGGLQQESVWIAFAAIATSSMFIGNWLGLRQENLKRLIAYSSISHLGYLMVGFLAISQDGIRSSMFYLLAYFASILAIFGMITYFSGKKGELIKIEDYRGLFWSKPWLAAVFTVIMLSLAGIPLTAGFLGKFYILTAGMGTGKIFLLIVLAVSSTIGLFYYLRVVAVMLSREESSIGEHIGSNSFMLKLAMAVLFVLIIWLGVYPSSFLQMIGI